MSIRRKLLGAANSLLQPFGFVLKRVSQPVRGFDDFFDCMKKKGFAPKTVFDVGVGFGTWELYRAFPNAKFVLVEPVAEQEETIKKVARSYDVSYHLKAVGDHEGEIEIGVETDRLEHSSLHDRTSLRISQAPVETRKVPITTLNTICKENDYEAPYLLKVDVEGAEVHALRGASEMMSNVDMVVVEVSIAKRFEDDTDLFEIISIMHGHGFVVFDVIGGATNKLGILSHIDLSFVKTTSPLREV